MPVKIVDEIMRAKYISFDVYGTLLLRKVTAPDEVFKLTGEFFFDKSEKVNEFYRLRKKIEKSLKKNSRGEIKLVEIYQEIKKKFPSEADEMMKIEIKIESDVAFANLFIKRIFQFCCEHNKKILIVSDMYLCKEFINEILFKNGYTGFHDLIVSSEWGSTKSSGKLWDDIIKHFLIEKRELIHFGDSLKGDFIKPMRRGINVALYRGNGKLYYVPGK